MGWHLKAKAPPGLFNRPDSFPVIIVGVVPGTLYNPHPPLAAVFRAAPPSFFFFAPPQFFVQAKRGLGLRTAAERVYSLQVSSLPHRHWRTPICVWHVVGRGTPGGRLSSFHIVWLTGATARQPRGGPGRGVCGRHGRGKLHPSYAFVWRV